MKTKSHNSYNEKLLENSKTYLGMSRSREERFDITWF